MHQHGHRACLANIVLPSAWHVVKEKVNVAAKLGCSSSTHNQQVLVAPLGHSSRLSMPHKPCVMGHLHTAGRTVDPLRGAFSEENIVPAHGAEPCYVPKAMRHQTAVCPSLRSSCPFPLRLLK